MNALRYLKGERGGALIVVLAFMVLTVPLTMAMLSFAGTMSLDSGTKRVQAERQYLTMAGEQHGVFRLLHDLTALNSECSNLPVNLPCLYEIDVDGRPVDVEIIKRIPTGEETEFESPSIRSRSRIEVEPESASPGEPETYTYVTTVYNISGGSVNFNNLHVVLPSTDFSYVTGSTESTIAGFPSNPDPPGGEPFEGSTKLEWKGIGYTLQDGESATIWFDVTATLIEGTYCAEVWMQAGGRELTTSGKRAPIIIGEPEPSQCAGHAIFITETVDPDVVSAQSEDPTTFTYTLTVENIGTEELELTRIRGFLPEGFLYDLGTTGGDITDDDPALQSGTRQRLTWDFGDPEDPIIISPTEVRYIIFDATAQPGFGTYFNDMWMEFAHSGDQKHYPDVIPGISAIDAFEIMAKKDGAQTRSFVWLGGEGEFALLSWEFGN